MIAKGINTFYTDPFKTSLCSLFGVEFCKLNSIIRHRGNKGNVMFFSHRMIYVNIIFIFHWLNFYTVSKANLAALIIIFILFCFQRGQGNSTAAYNSFPYRLNYVSAERANIKTAFFHI